MLFFKSRRHTGAVLCILITAAAMLLSSCGGGSQTPGKREALSNLSSMQIATGAGQGALYEITQPAGAERGGDLILVGRSQKKLDEQKAEVGPTVHAKLTAAEMALGYAVTVVDGTDTPLWEIITPADATTKGVRKDTKVELKYTGDRRVKEVTASAS